MDADLPLVVSTGALRDAVVRVLDVATRELGETIRLDADHYWSIDMRDAFDLSGAPDLIAGQLSDDLASVGSEEDVIVWHDLDHLIGILRRIAAIAREG